MNNSVRIFISYCHADKPFLDGLTKHMVALKRGGLAAIWTDREILSGDTLDQEISDSLNAADIVLLLVSVDFLNSDYCMSKEFQKSLKCKEETGNPRIVPVITRHCDWKSIPELAELKAPLDGKPIKGFQDMDEAYLGIVTEIRKIIQGRGEEKKTGEQYFLPENDDALQLLYQVLEYGKPGCRRDTGVMYMQRITGSHPDLISFSLIPEDGPTCMSTPGHRLPRKTEFDELADILLRCGIFDAVQIDQEGPWLNDRYRINMKIDLDDLKQKVVTEMQKRDIGTE